MLDAPKEDPGCTAYGSPMKLTGFEPSALGDDLRTYGCPHCKRVQRYAGERSETAAWLPKRQAAESRPKNMTKPTLASHGNLDDRAMEALEEARQLPHGLGRTAALKKAGLLQRAADDQGIIFARKGRPRN